MANRIKIAQNRGIIDRIKELNPINSIPYIFSSNLRDIRDLIVKYDDEARSAAKDIKSHLRKAESSFNRREYVNSVLDLRNFYADCKTVIYRFRELRTEVAPLKDDLKSQVLYGDHDDKSISRLVKCSRCNGYGTSSTSGKTCRTCGGTGMQVNFKDQKAKWRQFLKEKEKSDKKQNTDYTQAKQKTPTGKGGTYPFNGNNIFANNKINDNFIIKESGISDLWHNLTNDRAKSIYFWEKAFPQESKKIKENISRLISESNKFLDFLMSTFEELSSARADRRLGDYLNLEIKLRNKFWGNGGYNDRYFQYITAAFSDDVLFLYRRMAGGGDEKAKEVLKLMGKDMSEGEDTEPSPPVEVKSSPSTDGSAPREPEDSDENEDLLGPDELRALRSREKQKDPAASQSERPGSVEPLASNAPAAGQPTQISTTPTATSPVVSKKLIENNKDLDLDLGDNEEIQIDDGKSVKSSTAPTSETKSTEPNTSSLERLERLERLKESTLKVILDISERVFEVKMTQSDLDKDQLKEIDFAHKKLISRIMNNKPKGKNNENANANQKEELEILDKNKKALLANFNEYERAKKEIQALKGDSNSVDGQNKSAARFSYPERKWLLQKIAGKNFNF